jgi:hypothetical protein
MAVGTFCQSHSISAVMPALVAGIHVLLVALVGKEDVDGRDKPGHDDAAMLIP